MYFERIKEIRKTQNDVQTPTANYYRLNFNQSTI